MHDPSDLEWPFMSASILMTCNCLLFDPTPMDKATNATQLHALENLLIYDIQLSKTKYSQVGLLLWFVKSVQVKKKVSFGGVILQFPLLLRSLRSSLFSSLSSSSFSQEAVNNVRIEWIWSKELLQKKPQMIQIKEIYTNQWRPWLQHQLWPGSKLTPWWT